MLPTVPPPPPAAENGVTKCLCHSIPHRYHRKFFKSYTDSSRPGGSDDMYLF